MLGALEMHESPEIAILQHASGVMQVANNVFENGSKLKPAYPRTLTNSSSHILHQPHLRVHSIRRRKR